MDSFDHVVLYSSGSTKISSWDEFAWLRIVLCCEDINANLYDFLLFHLAYHRFNFLSQPFWFSSFCGCSSIIIEIMSGATVISTTTNTGLGDKLPLLPVPSSLEGGTKRRQVSSQGSLPLKKRLRFTPTHHGFSLDESFYSSSSTATNDSLDRSGSFTDDEATSPVRDIQQFEGGVEPSRGVAEGIASTSRTSGAEKLAALALIAASTTTNTMDAHPSQSNPPLVPLLKTQVMNPASAGNDISVSSVRSLPILSPRASAAAAANTAGASTISARSDSAPASPVAAQKQTLRGHSVPLTNPLPGGCHFRTSRNNSFCRRHSYNGSQYCKLHYHHYKIALEEQQLQQQNSSGAAIASPASLSSPTSGLRALDRAVAAQGYDGRPVQSSIPIPAASTVVPPSGNTSHAPVAPTALLPVPHQDRRYSSASPQGEKRCQATTTRGRACAYVSVNGTKYCYLHADYDTNPPPRRGGACQQTQLQNRQKLHALNTCKTASAGKSSAKLQVPSNADSAAAQLPVPLTVEGSSDLSSSSYTSLTLLSMISTDRWFRKLVIVAAGPLIHRTGRVEKWGNGWVTVRIPGMGVHNRRSFELYLHPKQEDAVPENQKRDSENAQYKQHLQEVPTQVVQQGKPEESNRGPGLTRCVSQDEASRANSILSATVPEKNPSQPSQGPSAKKMTEIATKASSDDPGMITDQDSRSSSSTPPPEVASPASTTSPTMAAGGVLSTPMQEASSLLLLLQEKSKVNKATIVTPVLQKTVAESDRTEADEIASPPFTKIIKQDCVSPSATGNNQVGGVESLGVGISTTSTVAAVRDTNSEENLPVVQV